MREAGGLSLDPGEGDKGHRESTRLCSGELWERM